MSVVDKTYCEHYRDGLPYCAKCEADRAERNEQMHAQIAEALGTSAIRSRILNKQTLDLAEARAEIERLRQELRDNSTLAARQIVPAEMLVDDLTAEIERKDALIEQMREALEFAKRRHYVNDDDNWYSCPVSGSCTDDNAGTCCNCGADRVNAIIEAALLAAERGE